MSGKNKKSLEEIHEYWINHSLPERYKDKTERSEFLYKYVKKYIDENGKILEIGCNVGRNLNYLYKHHFKNLMGVEISEEAIDALKKTYPVLFKDAEIICSPIEKIVKELPTNHLDLVFTMAVLEHIHPESEWIFKEIARITGRYLITIEAEKAKSSRIFPRNYNEIFEGFGLKQVESIRCDPKTGLNSYMLRVFEKKT